MSSNVWDFIDTILIERGYEEGRYYSVRCGLAVFVLQSDKSALKPDFAGLRIFAAVCIIVSLVVPVSESRLCSE
jgi:hypothetical protein